MFGRPCETCGRGLGVFAVRTRNPRTGAKECEACAYTASLHGEMVEYLNSIDPGMGDLWAADSPEYEDRFHAQPLKVREEIMVALGDMEVMLYGEGSKESALHVGTVPSQQSYVVRNTGDGFELLAGPFTMPATYPSPEADEVERQIEEAHARFPGSDIMDGEWVGSLVGLVDRRASLHTVAHDAGDGETIHHCPFCGSGNTVARSDGSAECGHCKTVFTVQVQPKHPYTPQTIDGVPYDNPELPGQVTDPTAEGTQPEQPPENEPTPGNESLIFVPPGQGEPFDPTKDQQAQQMAAKLAAKRYYLTAAGDPLNEESFLRHIAIMHADDQPTRDEVLAQVRAERVQRT